MLHTIKGKSSLHMQVIYQILGEQGSIMDGGASPCSTSDDMGSIGPEQTVHGLHQTRFPESDIHEMPPVGEASRSDVDRVPWSRKRWA